jgi:DNA-binding NarL/FixJ family response regulator
MTDPSSNRRARILVVDDEPFNVDYLEQELESHGFVTETAADGLEALERVAAAPPDLVLLDVMMPELDGISTLRILKRDPETRLIPVVLMTALNAADDRVRGIEAGADDFLSKPVNDRELLARIRTALSLKQTIDETVDELRSTSVHLERHGRQVREVAILAVHWRPDDPAQPAGTVAFLGRRRREAAERTVRALGGVPDESEAELLVAVFDGPDVPTRAVAAVEAALSILAEGASASGSSPLVVSAAVSSGPATVGSTRLEKAGTARWVYAAEGEPVDEAADLARDADGGEVVAARDAAAAVSDRFSLSPARNGAYRVVEAAAAEEPGTMSSRSVRRVQTILTTDIVGSTRTVERIGDRAWGELVAAHERGIRSELVRFGGEELDTAGDGFMGAFDSPARAIRCALAMVERARALELELRAGIHTGEVEHVEGRARGITLHVSSRIAAAAGGGELLVTATTRELAAGSGLVFADRGEHALKGIREPRRLYAAADGLAEPGASEAQPAVYPAGLTAREVDVLRLVAIGLSDAETAERLFLSVRTVNAHLRSIYRKLGIRSRTAASRFAEENGLL